VVPIERRLEGVLLAAAFAASLERPGHRVGALEQRLKVTQSGDLETECVHAHAFIGELTDEQRCSYRMLASTHRAQPYPGLFAEVDAGALVGLDVIEIVAHRPAL
jgi:hypothetical protein